MKRNPNIGKGWMVVGAVFIIVGLVMTIYRNSNYEKQIEQMKERCAGEGGELIVKKQGNFFTRSYDITCEK